MKLAGIRRKSIVQHASTVAVKMYRLRNRNVKLQKYVRKAKRAVRESAKSIFIGFHKKEISDSRDKLNFILHLIGIAKGDKYENPSRGEKCFWCAKKFYRKKNGFSWVKSARCKDFRCTHCAVKNCCCRESGEKCARDFSCNAVHSTSPLLLVSHIVKLDSVPFAL